MAMTAGHFKTALVRGDIANEFTNPVLDFMRQQQIHRRNSFAL
jgi:hypothetical protein